MEYKAYLKKTKNLGFLFKTLLYSSRNGLNLDMCFTVHFRKLFIDTATNLRSLANCQLARERTQRNTHHTKQG
jgi:hypothetical protein